MTSISDFAETAALVGDPARASMLMTLMDGRALTASELARAAGVTPQTASGHLSRLCTAGLLSIQRQGRHHYHRLASPAVAHMLETIMEVAQDNAPDAAPAGGHRAARPGDARRPHLLRSSRRPARGAARRLPVRARPRRAVARGRRGDARRHGILRGFRGRAAGAAGQHRPAGGGPRVLPPLPRLERAAAAYRRHAGCGVGSPLSLRSTGFAASTIRAPWR